MSWWNRKGGAAARVSSASSTGRGPDRGPVSRSGRGSRAEDRSSLDRATHELSLEDEPAPWEGAQDDSLATARAVLMARLDSGGFVLPLMPSTVRDAIQLTRDSKSSFVGLSGLIETDPSLAGELLQLANSPLFGGMQRVGSLKHALIRIGLNGIRELLMIASTARVLVVRGNRRLTDRLQRRAVAVALTADCIAHRAGMDGDAAFTAGILHDVGLAVAWQLVKDSRQELPAEFAEDVHAQKRLAEACHQAVGGKLGLSWNLPCETVAALERHHNPDPVASEHELARIIAAAIHIVDDLGVYPEDPDGLPAHERRHVQALGLFGPELREIKKIVARRLDIEVP